MVLHYCQRDYCFCGLADLMETEAQWDDGKVLLSQKSSPFIVRLKA